VTAPALVCPTCRGPLAGAQGASELRCELDHRVEVVAGIVDCRGELDGFDVEADRRRALALDGARDAGFEDLLRQYWSSMPEVPQHLVERFVRGDLIAADRAAEVARQIESETALHPDATTTVLEVGCGTAALGAAFAARAGSVVVTDVSLAWLVLARRRLEARGLGHVTVVAAAGDRLPFPPGTFDLVVAADVVEHVPDADAMVRSCYAALRPGGHLWLSTPNRLSLTPEPHVRLWGVGLLPRRLGVRFVRWRRGVDYGDVRTLSAFGLRRSLRRTGGTVHLEAPPIAEAVRATYGPVGARTIDAYHVARRLPLSRQALLAVSPLFHATVHKPHGA